MFSAPLQNWGLLVVVGGGVYVGGGQGQRAPRTGAKGRPHILGRGLYFPKVPFPSTVISRMRCLKLSIHAAYNTSGVLILIILLSEVLCCQGIEHDLWRLPIKGSIVNIATIIYQYSSAGGISRSTVVICNTEMIDCKKRLFLLRRTSSPGAAGSPCGKHVSTTSHTQRDSNFFFFFFKS